jgi:hypothetical protein
LLDLAAVLNRAHFQFLELLLLIVSALLAPLRLENKLGQLLSHLLQLALQIENRGIGLAKPYFLSFDLLMLLAVPSGDFKDLFAALGE